MMNKPTKEELQKINKLTTKELKEADVLVFKVALCNNDIDRDFEKFTVAALTEMAPMFIGKPGIFDHSFSAHDQKMRVFDTYLNEIAGKETQDGEPFVELMAKAYLINSEGNKTLIQEIESGIKHEVSVSCSMTKSVCSICGKDVRKTPCRHLAGKSYDGKQCFKTLEAPSDAYEFSFVAVPAQPEAGVRKSLKQKLDEGREFRTLKKVMGEFHFPICSQLHISEDKKLIISEEFDVNSSKGCDCSDFVMRNANGIIIARAKNGFNFRDMLRTATAEMKNAEISFKVAADEWKTIEHDDGVTEYRRIIKAIEKIYDVNAVPENGVGAVSASVRKVCDGVIAALEAERLRTAENEKRLHKERLKLKLKIMEVLNYED